jgi:hypothetical protein
VCRVGGQGEQCIQAPPLEFPDSPPCSFKVLEFLLDYEMGLRIELPALPLTTSEGVAGFGGARCRSPSVMHAASWLGQFVEHLLGVGHQK